EAGKLELARARFELEGVLEGALEIVAHAAAARGLDLATRLTDDLPTWVTGDPSRLRQVLLNLLSNAVKFTDAGEVTLTAAVAREDDDSLWISIVVRDTGIGIAEQDRERLFQVFTQLDDTASRNHGGTGLGLVITRELVEAMGGRITFESVAGEGTAFTVLLPFARGSCERAQEPALSGRALLLSRRRARTRLLAAQLEGWGLEVEVTDTPALARARLEATHDGAIALVDRELVDDAWLSRQRARAARIIAFTTPSASPTSPPLPADERLVALAWPVRSRRLRAVIVDLLSATSRLDERAPASTSLPRARAGATVLVVEDHPVNQRVARGLLQQMGYTVDVVASGERALEQLTRRAYDAVLMDCMMPGMDGYETTTRIRALPDERARTPIIAMTANAFREDQERCFAVGMNDFIAKPIRSDHLAETLRRWIA
ncbi:MAG: response regulator, partial [Myxococcales bacterium]|nr:response regulator [Myxococcales bacterium]